MKKIAFSIIALFCLFSAVGPVLAQGVENPLAGAGIENFYDLITHIISSLSGVITALGGLMIVIAGIFYLLSAGQQGMMTRAKNALGLAVIGIAVGLGASVITDIVNSVTSQGFETDILAIISNIAEQVGMLMASLGAVMVIVSGIFFLTSAGNQEKMGLAKKVLFYAAAGIVIGLAATTIVDVIADIFSATS